MASRAVLFVILPLLLSPAFVTASRPAPDQVVVDFTRTVAGPRSVSARKAGTRIVGLDVDFAGMDWKGLVLKAPGDYAFIDWARFSTAILELENPGKDAVKASFAMRNTPDSWQEGENASFSAVVPAGSRAKWRMPIQGLRYTIGWDWPRQPNLGALDGGWGRVDTRNIVEVWIRAEGKDVKLRLYRLSLSGPVRTEDWIDRYGQRMDYDWPGKVKSDDDIAGADRKEAAELDKWKPDPARDGYQAWKGAPARQATGFFRVEEVDGRWWFVAPNGNLFYAAGIDCIGPWMHARLDPVVEAAYSWLPPREGKFSSAWGKDSVSFYRVNMIRKWEADQVDQRAFDREIARCLAWGFTCLGNWCDGRLFPLKRLPYFTPGPSTWDMKVPFAGNKIHDAFHPDFESEAKRVCTSSLAQYKDDPWCVGHFVENEVGWSDFPARVLELPANQPARVNLTGHLKSLYPTVALLNQAWGITASSYEDARWPKKFKDDEARETAEKDMAPFRGEFAERWYRGWAEAVRAADPNHLVLGSRLHQGNRPDEVITACAKYMDVVSFNHYDVGAWKDEFDRYFTIARKPFLIGEYGFNSLDAGLLNTAVPVANQKERGTGYRYYTEQAASLPYFVGAHYFQWVDEPVTGRFDRETSFNGFNSVADIPYPELVKAAKTTNSRLYDLHAGAVKPFDRMPER
jgi:hypothetical protein